MDVLHYFAKSYVDARAKFLEAIRGVGDRAPVSLSTFVNPHLGPDGEELTTDVCVIGRPDARRVLLLIAGTHGNEGPCGTGCMVGFLRSGGWRALADDVRVVMVHAINPHGYAHIRRVNEDNVDLNRNFVDRDTLAPVSADYQEIADDIIPDDWDGPAREAADARLMAWADKHGIARLHHAMVGGQYSHPDGIFYGGRAPTWSNLTLRRIVREIVLPAETVATIDYHTGLGPFGHAELIHWHPAGSPQARRLQDWYGGGLATPSDGSTSSPPLPATTAHGILSELPAGTDLVALTAEYGTYEPRRVLNSLRGDQWLAMHPEAPGDLATAIKAEIAECLNPDSDDWRELIYLRSRQIVDRALKALAEGR
jgi:hypothetical protein